MPVVKKQCRATSTEKKDKTHRTMGNPVTCPISGEWGCFAHSQRDREIHRRQPPNSHKQTALVQDKHPTGDALGSTGNHASSNTSRRKFKLLL